MLNFNKYKYSFDLPKDLKPFSLSQLLEILQLHQLRLSAIDQLIQQIQNDKSPYIIKEKKEIETNITILDYYIDTNFDLLFEKEIMSPEPI